MDKIISFGKGIRRQPSIGEDGELSELVNLVPKNGELVNVKPMEEADAPEIRQISLTGTILCVHHVSQGDNYISLFKGSASAYITYSVKTNGEWATKTLKSGFDIEDNISVTAIGNILSVSTRDGIRYSIWKNDEYIWLGELPELNVSPYLTTERLSLSDLNAMFEPDLGSMTSRVLSGDEGVINASLLKELKQNPTKSIKLYGENRENVYSRVFSVINQYKHLLSKNGYFCSPFYVRFAYRMYDNSHIMQTEPILMAPNTWGKPVVQVDIDEDGVSTFEPIFLASKLNAKITLPDSLNKWKGIITHLDIIVSNEIVDYTDSSKSLVQIEIAPYWTYVKNGITDDNENIIDQWEYNELDAPMMMSGDKWRDINYPKNEGNGNAYLLNAVSYNGNEVLSFQRDKTYKERYLAIDNSSGKVELLNMSSKANTVIDPTGINPENFGLQGNYDIYDLHDIAKRSYTVRVMFKGDVTGYNILGPYDEKTFNLLHFHIKLERVDDNSYEEQIRTESDYRKVGEYNLDEIVDDESSSDVGQKVISGEVPLISGVLLTRSNQSAVLSSASSLKELRVSQSLVYNDRLNIIIDNIRYRQNQSLKNHNPCLDVKTGVNIRKAYVTIFENGQYSHVEIPADNILLRNIKYFSYPSSTAITLVLLASTQDRQYKYEIQLQRHATLDVAYAFNDYHTLEYSVYEGNTPFEMPNNTDIVYGNMVYQSNAAQPFVFSSENSTHVSSKLIGLSTSAKALSQGQFGQFPLYAFCTDGIWALEVASDGSYSARQPISRDVCNNPDSITQIDGAVVFTTDQGLKMIQGSDVVLLSGNMDGHNVDEKIYFKDSGDKKFFASKGDKFVDYDKLLVQEMRDFREILRKCRIAYDYPNNLLRIYPKENKGKYYVFDLGTREFSSVADDGIVHAVIPDYPTSLVQKDTKAYTFANTSDNVNLRDGLLLTRPISFGEPYSLKKLHDLRLHYTKMHAGSKCYVVMFVSNDNVHWAELTSLRKGSFKYYRFALVTRLTDDDRLSGLMMRYEVERNNKMR